MSRKQLISGRKCISLRMRQHCVHSDACGDIHEATGVVVMEEVCCAYDAAGCQLHPLGGHRSPCARLGALKSALTNIVTLTLPMGPLSSSNFL